MTISDALHGVQRIFLDTAPVIYFVEQNPRYSAQVEEVFRRLDAGTIVGVTSPVTLAECLHLPLQKDDHELTAVFAELLVGGPNTKFQVIDSAVATMAADISVRHKLRLPDAFQLAAAVTAGCDAFLTNDVQLRRVQGINVVILDQIGI